MTTERVLITSDTTSKVILIQGIQGSITPQISESHFSSIKPKLVWNIWRMWRFTDFFKNILISKSLKIDITHMQTF